MNSNQIVQTSGSQSPTSIGPVSDFSHPPSILGNAGFLRPTRSRLVDYGERKNQQISFADVDTEGLDELRRNFVFSAGLSVSELLTRHPTMTQLLLGAVPHLKRCFGPDTVFRLRTSCDESGTLYASVIWPGDPEIVRDALAEFDETWWDHHLRPVAGFLTFTYELV